MSEKPLPSGTQTLTFRYLIELKLLWKTEEDPLSKMSLPLHPFQDESPPTPSIYLNSETHFHTTSTSIHGSHEMIKKASKIPDFKKA